MKKILSFVMVAVLAVMLAGCDKYDDTELRNKVNGYEARIAALESLASYQTLLQKLQAGKTVTSYSKSGEEITLTFSDGTSVTFNQKGEPGESIQGDPGTPGVTPQFKIEGENWMVSYDEGKTWQNAGQAVEHSLFQNVTADGNTLTITLADGNVINVPYGEKEGYTFTIGDGTRKVFSFYETKTSEITGQMQIPYTLTGDIENPEDVKFLISVKPFVAQEDPVPTTAAAVFVIPETAKTGSIELNRLIINSSFDEEAWYLDFPGYEATIMAIFPDGTVSAQSLRVLRESLYYTSNGAGNEDVDWIGYGVDQPRIVFPKTSGKVKLRLIHSIGGIDYYEYRGNATISDYDGAPLSAFTFTDLFKASQWGNYTLPNPTVSAPEVYNGKYFFEVEYNISYTRYQNNTGKDRGTWFDLVQHYKEGDNGGYVRFQLYGLQTAD